MSSRVLDVDIGQSDSLGVLTNAVAIALADVGEEGQSRLGLRTAVVGEFRLNGLGAADSRKIVGVARVIAADGQYRQS